MYLMDKNTEKPETVKGRKRKALKEELVSAKKRKEKLEIITQKLIDTADKKTKEAEKKKDVTHLKALLIEANTSKEKSGKIQKKDLPVQEKEIMDLQ